MNQEQEVLTDAEFWAVLAETLRGHGEVQFGLCFELLRAHIDDLISSSTQADRLRQQLYFYRRQIGGNKGKTHFWPKRRLAPRIRACYKLAALASKDEGHAA